jgi:hypothetical protein
MPAPPAPFNYARVSISGECCFQTTKRTAILDVPINERPRRRIEFDTLRDIPDEYIRRCTKFKGKRCEVCFRTLHTHCNHVLRPGAST